MSQAITQIQQLAKQNLDLQGEIAAIRDRLDALDSQIGEIKPPAPDATPGPDKW
jgi:prefoldin subunit 5